MNNIASYALTFLFGAATGAAGQYFADKYTDQRRRQESKAAISKEFSEVAQLMPDLLRQMQEDLEDPTHATWREFYVIPRGTQVFATPNTFYYAYDSNNDFLNKTKILESRGYVRDLTTGSAPKFRMTEAFVANLKALPT
jgi:hypothetical protein